MRFSVLSVAGTLLVLLAVARMAAFVVHDPLLGFANQYDMIRTSACVGLYPDVPADKRDEATPEAPLERYKLGARNPQECRWGSEALLASLVVAKQRVLGNADGAFNALRQLGVLEVGLAALAMLAFAVAFWPYPVAAFLHGLTL